MGFPVAHRDAGFILPDRLHLGHGDLQSRRLPAESLNICVITQRDDIARRGDHAEPGVNMGSSASSAACESPSGG